MTNPVPKNSIIGRQDFETWGMIVAATFSDILVKDASNELKKVVVN